MVFGINLMFGDFLKMITSNYLKERFNNDWSKLYGKQKKSMIERLFSQSSENFIDINVMRLYEEVKTLARYFRVLDYYL
jgi:hypothetical protein